MGPAEPRQLRIYSDGASRGNPGPAAIAVKILDENGVVLKKFSKFLGNKTNNEAEYESVIEALELARNFGGRTVDFFLDSELVMKQLNEEYRVRNPRLKILWVEVCRLKRYFQEVSFNHVPRTDRNIEEVDRLANSVLDKMLG